MKMFTSSTSRQHCPAGSTNGRFFTPPPPRPSRLALEYHLPKATSSNAADASPSPAAEERAAWVSSVRNTVGRQKDGLWTTPDVNLSPPPLLSDIAVVLVSPKRPSSVGAVARALSCFECIDLRLVTPRCDHLARSARNGSKGAQYILYRATVHPSLEDALHGSQSSSIAFTRWVNGIADTVPTYRSITELLNSKLVSIKSDPPPPVSLPLISSEEEKEERIEEPAESSNSNPKLILVFGREEEGLRPEEVTSCTAACSIPIGRLQESLSLSHAVSLVLAPIFEARQMMEMMMHQNGTDTSAPLLLRVGSKEDLGDGVALDDT